MSRISNHVLEAISTVGLQIDFPQTLFVTDCEGNILLSNTFSAFSMGMTLEEVQSSNVADLVRNNVYNVSTTLEAIKQKKTITGMIRTRMGFNVLSTSTPLLNENGEVYLVVTSSDPELIEDKEMKALYDKNDPKNADWSPEREEEYGIIADSKAMRNILKVCNQIAPTDCKVLLYGESGTGKEVLSNYIHKKSKRAEEAFISVNCAAIPENLFESELFGYEKGAFTGAVQMKKGLIELADNGTLFLDEISETPLDMQAKLLRVLETREVRRVGGTENFQVNFRLIAATNKNLLELVKEGKFREDLYYRLNVIQIQILPLRKRKKDIIKLAYKYLKDFNQMYQKDFKLRACHFQYLLNYDWPGNTRELRNYIERIVVVSEGGLDSSYINEDERPLIDIDTMIDINPDRIPTLKEVLREVEEKYIKRVLLECEGKKEKAAEKLGIYRTVLYRKLKSFEEDHQKIH
nr:sigma 54-interacting transcriptional regulator [uncultured Bacillus sp.]